MNWMSPKRKARIGKINIRLMLFFYGLKQKNSIGRILFKLYETALQLVNMSVLPVVNAKVYREITSNVEISVVETNRVGVTANILMAGSEEKPVLIEKPLPDLRIKVFNNVCIQGNSDVVVDVQNGYVISEEAYNVEDNVEIIDGLLYRTRDNVCLLRDNLRHKKEFILHGIMISGKFCNNYYHLLFENYNKLIYIDDSIISNSIPLIIDRKTIEIPSCKMILDILNKNNERPIIIIEPNIIYHFRSLFCVDHVNKLPPHLKDPQKQAEALYSPKALLRLRETLMAAKSTDHFPARLFITRYSTKRRHFNEDEVLRVLKKYGFTCIAPENYSFGEQVSLFNNAEFIVAGSGAALSNLLFVGSNCRVICFGRSTLDKVNEMSCFNTIANLNGALFYFFPRKKNVDTDIHVDFEIDCNLLEKTIAKMIR